MRSKRGTKRFTWAFVTLIVLATYSAYALLRPLAPIQPDNHKSSLGLNTQDPALSWHTKGQSAVTILNSDILETHGSQKPVPMASTAKVITALMVLQKKPLGKGQAGPSYVITPTDVEIYNRYVAQDGTVLPVKAGTQLSQYQMLQAMMLPSANNIADALAVWSYGSLSAYSKAANTYLKSQGINNTTVGSDASGLSPDSITTAEDLVKIGKLAMKHVVLAEVVGQSSVTNLPGNPIVRNVNTLLGKDGIIGIKTGTSDQAGGAFLGAAKHKIGNKDLTIITAVVGATNRPEALAASQRLIRSAQSNFIKNDLVKKEQTIATYSAPWGEQRKAVALKDKNLVAWKGEKIQADVKLSEVKLGQKDAGKILVQSSVAENEDSIPVALDKPFEGPGVAWRLTHPID